MVLVLVVRLTPVIVMLRRQCERDECSFIFVVAVARFFLPMENTLRHMPTSFMRPKDLAILYNIIYIIISLVNTDQNDHICEIQSEEVRKEVSTTIY